MARRLSVTEYCQGILTGKKRILSKAITLVESQKLSDQQLAQDVLQALLPHTGTAIRIGITGVPGVGKSSLLDNFGMMLIEKGHSVAVLAIDPSSSLHGGAILGDKTRMNRLSLSEKAFVRPSPTNRHLGGVARSTREAMLLCEAFGFDVVIIESVGVGQSEVGVGDMVDSFVSLMLPGAGDELQGIKKGLLEVSDIIAINKADGKNKLYAELAEKEYRAALQYLPQRYQNWKTKTICISGLYGDGLPTLWDVILAHKEALENSGELRQLRQQQQVKWFRSSLEYRILEQLKIDTRVKNMLPIVEKMVQNGELSVSVAVHQIVQQLFYVK